MVRMPKRYRTTITQTRQIWNIIRRAIWKNSMLSLNAVIDFKRSNSIVYLHSVCLIVGTKVHLVELRPPWFYYCGYQGKSQRHIRSMILVLSGRTQKSSGIEIEFKDVMVHSITTCLLLTYLIRALMVNKLRLVMTPMLDITDVQADHA